MLEFVESTLFLDPQQQRDFYFCPVCGGERYAPGYHCLRCERDGL